jgi:hypothetical protein
MRRRRRHRHPAHQFTGTLSQDGLTISNNGGSPIAVPKGTTYLDYPGGIGSDANFDIKVVTNPPNATCTPYFARGRAAGYSPTGIYIECVTTPHSVFANITGLTGQGLVIVNGANQWTIPAGTTRFDFTRRNEKGEVTGGQVNDGSSYAFLVLSQPAGQTCSVTNGTGVMGNTDVTIGISCI